MNFVDYARITVVSGDGGDGAKSFRREKYVPHGGPDGGDGGHGGSVILIADPAIVTLYDFRTQAIYKARHGINGGPKNCTGHNGADCLIPVPLGTQVFSEDGQLLADLTRPGQRWVAAKGGRGGLGNQHFVTSTNQAPRKIIPGEEGETKVLLLELKMIADVGLVGLPNAGKSTLLAALTKAEPKIAEYPFTTIHPNLGVLHFDSSRRCVIADIPGLIEGAHTGAGLGDRFLRHIERTGVLLHLVSPPDGHQPGEPLDPEDMVYAHDLVTAELAAYSDLLATKPRAVVLTKTDLLTPGQVEAVVAAFAARGIAPVHAICAHNRSESNGDGGIRALLDHLAQLLDQHQPRRDWEDLHAAHPEIAAARPAPATAISPLDIEVEDGEEPEDDFDGDDSADGHDDDDTDASTGDDDNHDEDDGPGLEVVYGSGLESGDDPVSVVDGPDAPGARPAKVHSPYSVHGAVRIEFPQDEDGRPAKRPRRDQAAPAAPASPNRPAPPGPLPTRSAAEVFANAPSPGDILAAITGQTRKTSND